ncbi:MAG: M28 family peptidase [Candidatus Pacebacteria bacterium]|nr:M28 family peptidase [Candidatus Paceibacterota bacterium]
MKKKIPGLLERIKILAALGERQGATETKARRIIEEWLLALEVAYSTQEFVTQIPNVLSSRLFADGKQLRAESTAFKSGEVKGKDAIISSLISSQRFLYDANINVNPACNGISRSNHYFAPSFAVHRKDIATLLRADKVFGSVKVQKVSHRSANILVGNTKNPTAVLFCHYDSIHAGAVDNASGVSVMCELIQQNRELLRNCLFVFAGNEEVSYDEPIYWGHGYRVFERSMTTVLKKTRRIIVVDCVGQTKSIATSDPKLLMLGFPLDSIKTLVSKTTMVCGDFAALMRIYHSSQDTIAEVSIKNLKQAVMLTRQLIARAVKS